MGRKSDWQGVWIITGLIVVVGVGAIMAGLTGSFDSCRMDVPQKTTEVKNIIERVCNDPTSGTQESFNPTGCPSRYELMGTNCYEAAFRMFLRGTLQAAGQSARQLGYIMNVKVFGQDPERIRFPTNGERIAVSGTDQNALEEMFRNANGLSEPESVIVEASTAFQGDYSRMPSDSLFSFFQNDMPVLLGNENLGKAPVGIDRTIVIGDVSESDLTPAMLQSTLAVERMSGIWKSDFNRQIQGVYGAIGMQIYGDVTYSSDKAPAFSSIFTLIGGRMTLRPERARHLASSFFKFMRDKGKGDVPSFAETANSTVWNSADPWSELVLQSVRFASITCEGSENFCSQMGAATDMISGAEVALSEIRLKYASIESARADVFSLIERKISAGTCQVYSGTGYRIPSCAAMISCSSFDRELVGRIQAESCLISAINLEGNPSAFPLGAIPKEAALEIWDVNIPERVDSRVSGEYSFRAAMDCPTIFEPEKQKRTITICMHDLKPDCWKSNSCFYCYTISCALRVDFYTRASTGVSVKNGEGVTNVSGAIYALR